MKNLFASQQFLLQQPNFLKPRVLKRRSWKTLNILSTLAIVLNTGMIGVFLQPQTTQAATPIPTPVANPILGQACGLDIALVIDSSSSISNSELTQMKNAYKAFVDAFLPGTPTQMSVTEFDTTATVRQGFTANVTSLKNAITAADSSGYTNWEDGLLKAWSTFDPRPAKQNLILFASDGNPNRKGTAGTNVSESEAVTAAVAQANAFKTAGTRIVTLGIGNDLNVDNLKAISGPNVNTGITSDVITTDFASLAGTLATLANQLCGGKILVQKQFDTNGDGQVDVTGSQTNPLLAGWTFDVDGAPSNPAAQTTTNTGSLEFSVLNGTYTIAEINQISGTQFVTAQCLLGTQPVGQLNAQTKSITGLTLSNDQTISCTFLNQVSKVKLTMYKKFDHNGDGVVDAFNPLDWTWDVVGGPQNNLPGDENGIMLSAGTYTITEDALPGYSATWLCGDDTSGTGTSLPITLNPGRNMTCSFKNVRDTGRITFNKVVVGGSAQDTDFVFTTDGRQFIDGQSGTFLTGTYPLTEAAVAGYTLTNASGACSKNAQGQITLNVTSNGGTCTITNTRDAGTLIVHKDVLNPDGNAVSDTHDFTVRVNGATPKTIAEGDAATYSNLPTGTYSITEDANGDYTFVSFNHDLDATTPGSQVAITKGQTTHLTVTNKQKKATITISKDVRDFRGNQVVDSTVFPVSSNAGNFTISENAPKVLSVNPGTYTFTESSQNYTVKSTNPKTITVGSNQQASYTFVNWQKTGSIAGKKFEDTNGNGVRNTGEGWLEDWKIYLDVNSNDRWDIGEPYDYTNHDGEYFFGNLTPGTYTVREVQQTGWAQTAPVTGEYTVTLTVNQDVDGKDFGNFKLGKIWGFKYEDMTANGFVNQSDVKKDGWTIELWKNNAKVSEAVTGAGAWTLGYYEFTGLTAGTYTVKEVPVSGWFAVNPLMPGHTLTISSGESEHRDFLNFKGFDLTAKKLLDTDGNLQTTADQTLAAGWTLELWKDGTKVDTQVTAANGAYTWTNLGPGEYQVKEQFDSTKYQPLLADNITAPNWNDDSSAKDVAAFDAVSGTNVEATFINWDHRPVLGLTKTATPNPVPVNQDVHYTLTWSISNSQATNLVLIDPVPTNTTFVSADNGGVYDATTKTVTWNLGTKQPGDTGVVHMVVKSPLIAANGLVLVNTATLKSAEIDPGVQASASVTVVSNPQLQITKTVNAVFVNPGDPITYTVKVKNVGTDTAVNVTVADTLPAGFTFVDGGLNTKTFTLGNMLVGEEKTITYQVQVGTSVTAGTKENLAKAKADNAAEVQTKVGVDVRIPRVLGETTAPALQLKKTVSKATVAPGDTVQYTVEIKNTGTGEAVNVILQDVLPLGFTFKGSTDTSKTWNLGNLAAGGTKTVTYDVVVSKSVPNGSYENLAFASADNHGKVTTSVPVQVKRGRVLGESLASTGASMLDLMVAVAGAGLISFGVFLLRRRKEGSPA